MVLKIELQSVFSKALFYSVILHMIIVVSVKFAIPAKKEPNKPVLVFFGALFRDSELAEVMTKQNEHFPAGKTTIPYALPSKAPYEDRSVPKPIGLDVVPSQAKKTPKVIQRAEPEKKIPSRENMEELHLPAMPAYKPLRFHSE